MKLLQIREREIVIALSVEDALVLARACDDAAEATMARGLPDTAVQLFEALSAGLEAAALAATMAGDLGAGAKREHTIERLWATSDPLAALDAALTA